MAECAVISNNILVDCDNPLQAGTKDTLILINYDDWLDAAVSVNGTNARIIEDIVLASGVTGYKVEGINNSTLPTHAFVKGRFLGSFDHQVNFKCFTLSPTVKSELVKMSKGRFVAIVENNFKGATGNAAYEVYGMDSGLILETMERDPGNQDTQGAYDVTLKSSEFSREAHLPATIFITDYDTTKTLVDGLYS